jgi:hypothetical protein
MLQQLLLQLFLGLEQGFDFRVDTAHAKTHHLLSPAYKERFGQFVENEVKAKVSIIYIVYIKITNTSNTIWWLYLIANLCPE